MLYGVAIEQWSVHCCVRDNTQQNTGGILPATMLVLLLLLLLLLELKELIMHHILQYARASIHTQTKKHV